MTWVKGTTTWGAVASDLTRLICGEMADSTSTTVAVGDRWVREFTRTVTDGVLNSTTTVTSATANFTNADVGAAVIGTGIPAGARVSTVTNSTTIVLTVAASTTASAVTIQIAHDTIRTPSAKDVNTGSVSARCGYFLSLGVSGDSMATARSTVVRVSSPFTADPSTSGFHRWVVGMKVTTANTVPGNYSTAVLSFNYYDADSGSNLSTSSVTLNASGVGTMGSGLQITCSDPSGTLTLNSLFIRGFTSTYMRGIDCWPMYYRASAAATFSVNPPGTQGTDWDIVTQINAPVANSTAWNQTYSSERGSLFTGLGIKTATGLGTGDLYTLSFPMALAKGRIFASATNGILSLDVGQSRVDTVNGNALRVGAGIRVTNWLKCAATAASVATTSQIQYWISVKSDGIALVLNMDPAATGKMGTAYFGSYTPYDTTYDVFPIMFNVDGPVDWSSVASSASGYMMGNQYAYLALVRRQDGSEGSRDWQTKWMRGECLGIAQGVGYSGHGPTDSTASFQVAANSTNISPARMAPLGIYAGDLSAGGATQAQYPPRQNKPSPIDGKWWLYGFDYTEGQFNSSGAANDDENRNWRGYMNTRFFYIPNGSWANGDDLTDSGSGAKYFLCTPDYTGMGGRNLQATVQAGLAVAEI
jgi:hypothetical protein